LFGVRQALRGARKALLLGKWIKHGLFRVRQALRGARKALLLTRG